MRKQKSDIMVSKGLSMPLSLAQEVLDEAFIMQGSFSEAATLLLKIGLRTRKEQRNLSESDKK